MDSDAKELGHVRAADRKTIWAYQAQNVIIHSCVGNSTPNRKFANGSGVFAFAINTHESAIEQASVENKCVSGVRAIQNAGLRCPVWDGPAVLLPRQQAKLARGAKDKEHAMSQTPNTAIAVIGIDIGKNSFHVVGHDARGAIVLRQKWSRGQGGYFCPVPARPRGVSRSSRTLGRNAMDAKPPCA